MKDIVKDMERFTEAVSTIEELLPNVRSYLVLAMDKEKNGVLALTMWQFISSQNVSTRLKNIVGIMATPDMTVLDFIEQCPKMKFVKGDRARAGADLPEQPGTMEIRHYGYDSYDLDRSQRAGTGT